MVNCRDWLRIYFCSTLHGRINGALAHFFHLFVLCIRIVVSRLIAQGDACAAGSVCVTPATQIACAPGQFCPSNSTAAAWCSPGHYCNTATSQSACPVGSLCRAAGLSAPRPCDAGYFCNATALSSTASGMCRANEFSVAGQSACSPCPSGMISLPGAFVCSVTACMMGGCDGAFYDVKVATFLNNSALTHSCMYCQMLTNPLIATRPPAKPCISCAVIVILPTSLSIGALDALVLDATASTGQVGAAFVASWTLTEWPAGNVMSADLLAAVRARLAAASTGGLLRVTIDAAMLPLPPAAVGYLSFVFVLRLENQYAYSATARVSVRKSRVGAPPATLAGPAAAPAAEGMSIGLLAGAGAGGLVAIAVVAWCAWRHCDCCGDGASSAKVSAHDAADDRMPISIASPRNADGSAAAAKGLWAPVGIEN